MICISIDDKSPRSNHVQVSICIDISNITFLCDNTSTSVTTPVAILSAKLEIQTQKAFDIHKHVVFTPSH